MWSRRALILAGFAGALPLRADEPKVKLRVEVTNHKGTALERASVIVKFTERGVLTRLKRKKVHTWEMRTDQDGVATFPTMPQGTALVMVIAEPYQTFGEEFELNEEEKTIQVELLPPQQQYSVHQ